MKHLRKREHTSVKRIAIVAAFGLLGGQLLLTGVGATGYTSSLNPGDTLAATCSGTSLTPTQVSATAVNLSCVGGTTEATPPPPSASALYGVTVDDISNLPAIISGMKALPEQPSAQIYFDVQEPASYYATAVSEIHAMGPVLGELLDSSDETSISTAAFQTRVESYLSTLGSNVDIYEVGDEVNGNWTGPYATVAAKLIEAYNDVAADGYKTALTLYANNFGPDNCGDGTSELTPVQFTQQYVPTTVADGLHYVFLSYYPTECDNEYPSSATVASYLEQLHALYPNALLGFGEVGLPNAVTSKTLATGEKVMSWAYSLNPGLSYYVGGYYWWYGYEDVFTGSKLLASSLNSAFEAEASAIG